MRFPGIRRAWLVTGGMMLLVLLAGGYWTQKRLHVWWDSLGPVIEAQLRASLDREIEIGNIEYKSLGRLVLEDVVVPYESEDAPEPQLSIRRVEVRYRWLEVLHRQIKPDEAISQVLVDGLVLNLRRDADGKLDLADLLPEKDEEERPVRFRGEVIIRDSRVQFRDDFEHSVGRQVNALTNLEIHLDAASYPRLRYDVEGRLEASRGGPVRAHGYFEIETKDWFANVNLDMGDAEYWYRYLVRPRLPEDGRDRMTLSGGRLVAEVAVGNMGESENPLDTLDWLGSATISDLRIEGEDLPAPVELAHAKLEFDGLSVEYAVQGKIAEVIVEATGNATFQEAWSARITARVENVTQSSLDLLLPEGTDLQSVTLLQPARALLKARISGHEVEADGHVLLPRVEREGLEATNARAQFHARWNGEDLAGLTVEGQIVTPVVTSADPEVEVRDAKARFRLRDEYLEVWDVEAAALDGRLTARGWADLRAQPVEFYALASAEHVDLAQIPLPRNEEKEASSDLGLWGWAGVELVVSGNLDDYETHAYVDAEQVKFGDGEIAADRVVARAHWQPGQPLRISDAYIYHELGTARVWGTVSMEGELDLELQTEGLDLADLAAGRAPDALGLAGQCWARAHITGTAQDPVVEGDVALYNLRVQGVDVAHAQGRVSVHGLEDIQLLEWTVSIPPAAVTVPDLRLVRFSSDAGLAGWSVRGSATVEGLLLTRAMRLAGVDEKTLLDYPVSGELTSASINVSGTLDEPRVAFEAQLQRVTVPDYRFGAITLAGSADLGARRLVLDDATSVSDLGHMRLSGSVTLAETSEETGSPASVLDGARLELDFSASDLDALRLISRRGAKALEYAVLEGKIAHISAQVRGEWPRPIITGEVRTTPLRLNGIPVEAVTAKLEIEPGYAFVEGLSLVTPRGRLDAPAVAVWWPEGETPRLALEYVAGSVTMEGVQIGLLRDLWLGSPMRGLGGEPAANVRAWLHTLPEDDGVISGEILLPGGPEPRARMDLADRAKLAAFRGENAVARGKLTVRGLDWWGPPLGVDRRPTWPERLTLDADASLLWRDGQLQFEQVTVRDCASSEATLAVSGVWTWEEAAQNVSPLDLHVQISSVPLRWLRAIPGSAARQAVANLQPLQGQVTLDGSISGPLNRPEVKLAHAAVTDLVLAGLPFEDVVVQGAAIGGQATRITLPITTIALSRDGVGPEAAAGAGLNVRVAASVPWDWETRSVPRDRPRRLELIIPRQDLSAFRDLARAGAPEEAASTIQRLAGLAQRLSASEGNFEGRIVVAGTAASPQNDGFFELRNGGFRFGDANTQLLDFNTRVELVGGLIRLTRFEGRSSVSGGFSGGGTIRLAAGEEGRIRPLLDLTLSVNQLRVREDDLGQALAGSWQGGQARFTLQSVSASSPARAAPWRITGDLSSPLITGAMTISEARIIPPGGYQPSDETKTAPAINPRFDLRFFVTDNNRLDLRVLRLPLQGEMRVTGSAAEPVVRGDLHAEKGSLRLPSLHMRVDGEFGIDYDAARRASVGAYQPLITVDMEARGRVRLQEGLDADVREYELIVTVTGGLGGEVESGRATIGLAGQAQPGAGDVPLGLPGSALNVQVRTDPPVSSRMANTILRQQLGMGGFAVGGDNVQLSVANQLRRTIFTAGGSAVVGGLTGHVEQLLGLETLSVDLGIERPVSLRVVKRLYADLYLAFFQEVASTVGEDRQEFELFYRLGRRLRIGYRNDRRNNDQVIFFGGALPF